MIYFLLALVWFAIGAATHFLGTLRFQGKFTVADAIDGIYMLFLGPFLTGFLIYLALKSYRDEHGGEVLFEVDRPQTPARPRRETPPDIEEIQGYENGKPWDVNLDDL